MKVILSLIKLRQSELEQYRSQVAQLQYQLQKCEQELCDLATKVTAEEEYINKNPGSLSFTSSSYYQWVKEKSRKIAENIEIIKKNIEEVHDQIRKVFHEQKKYQIIYDKWQEEQKQLLKKQAQEELFDQINLR